MTEFEHDDLSADWELEKSKTQIKQELHALKELGRELIELSPNDLKKLDLDEDLADAIKQAQSMSKGALKRQVGFIGGLIAARDHEVIKQRLTSLRQPHQGEVQRFHQLESWRDRLLANEDGIFNELMAVFSDFDIQHVRQIVRNASREAQQSKPPKAARQLFQYLQSLMSR